MGIKPDEIRIHDMCENGKPWMVLKMVKKWPTTQSLNFKKK